MIKVSRKKTRYRKKNICYFTKNNITSINYKDVDLLKKFITKSGEMIPRSFTGVKNRYQKYLSKAIKRARFLGLLGYSGQKPKKLMTENIVSKKLIETLVSKPVLKTEEKK